jgi:hypothetical protein
MLYVLTGLLVLAITWIATREARFHPLRIEAAPQERKDRREIGLPWSILIIPLLFVLAGLALPYALLAAPLQRRRARAFLAQMKARNRVMGWPDFQPAVDEARGTLIVERHPLKGPFRWWWIPENLYHACPLLMVHWLDRAQHDECYRPLAQWCRQTYTSPEEGRAFLVEDVPPREVAFPESLIGSRSPSLKWIEIASPDSLRKSRRPLAANPAPVVD